MKSPDSATAITIRKAKDDEYHAIADLYQAATANDPLERLLTGNVSPEAYKQWARINGAKAMVQKGSDTVLVAVTGSKEIVGVAWYKKFSSSSPPPTPGNLPEGFNVEENAKVAGPRGNWFREMVSKYGTYYYLRELEVAPSHPEGAMIREKLFNHIIEEAKRCAYNIATTTVPSSREFYKQVGFQEVAKPVMLVEGTVEGVTMMFMELFQVNDEPVERM